MARFLQTSTARAPPSALFSSITQETNHAASFHRHRRVLRPGREPGRQRPGHRAPGQPQVRPLRRRVVHEGNLRQVQHQAGRAPVRQGHRHHAGHHRRRGRPRRLRRRRLDFRPRQRRTHLRRRRLRQGRDAHRGPGRIRHQDPARPEGQEGGRHPRQPAGTTALGRTGEERPDLVGQAGQGRAAGLSLLPRPQPGAGRQADRRHEPVRTAVVAGDPEAVRP